MPGRLYCGAGQPFTAQGRKGRTCERGFTDADKLSQVSGSVRRKILS